MISNDNKEYHHGNHLDKHSQKNNSKSGPNKIKKERNTNTTAIRNLNTNTLSSHGHHMVITWTNTVKRTTARVVPTKRGAAGTTPTLEESNENDDNINSK